MVNWLADDILLSPSCSWWFPPSPLISSFWTRPSPKNMKLSHCSLCLHAMMKILHQVWHIPSTSSSQDQLSSGPSQSLTSHPSANLGVLNSLHSYNSEITNEFSLRSLTWLLIDLPPPDRKPPDQVPYDQLPTDRQPSNTPSISNEHGLQMLLETPSISAFKFISKHTWSWLPSPSSILLDYGLQVHIKVPIIAVCGNGGALMPSNGNPWERAVLTWRRV